MAFGIKVWNSAGAVSFSITDRLLRYHSKMIIGSIGARSSYTVAVTGMAADGTWGAAAGYQCFCDIQAGQVVVHNWTAVSNSNVDLVIFRT